MIAWEYVTTQCNAMQCVEFPKFRFYAFSSRSGPSRSGLLEPIGAARSGPSRSGLLDRARADRGCSSRSGLLEPIGPEPIGAARSIGPEPPVSAACGPSGPWPLGTQAQRRSLPLLQGSKPLGCGGARLGRTALGCGAQGRCLPLLHGSAAVWCVGAGLYRAAAGDLSARGRGRTRETH